MTLRKIVLAGGGMVFLSLLLLACAAPPVPVTPSATPAAVTSQAIVPSATATPAPPQSTPAPSQTARPSQGKTSSPTAPAAVSWEDLPVVPTSFSERALEIYQRGLEMGNRPDAFSKVGDCESQTTWYLWDFDQEEDLYSLGDYGQLQEVIDYYHGSFGRLSLAANRGFTAASLMTSLWADQEKCQQDESPLACEYRIHRPSMALITLGTNDASRPEKFEANMRLVIEYSIQQGVLPILATKADNVEGDNQINATIAALAQEYELPLWNFWAAAQDLPDQGLQEDGAHLTWSPNHFEDEQNMRRAWPVRNLTALQVLDVAWHSVNSQNR
ncbi:MAG: hypothetical protein GYA17_11820 [Chloroflexi bacterium]|nr:hypothetical protein [Anaerolineaceae bacterium]NMB89039.1 hypothetical protein [Chloroflexota bacterium]